MPIFATLQILEKINRHTEFTLNARHQRNKREDKAPQLFVTHLSHPYSFVIFTQNTPHVHGDQLQRGEENRRHEVLL